MNNNDKKKLLLATKKEIGFNIWKAIEQSNLPREYVAEKLQVNTRTVNYWQSGTKLPTIEKLILLCELLEVSLEGLLFS
jgi:transcriptional regulator with XRE-family HTH domain